ncbi:MAG: 4-hydroxy-tetrahydrodipicolinate reductase [Clostridiales bacterium]|nr:4-hydroxy-tetrahydrodipicolinate reductase [Clostridiales bacterium]
MIRLLINGISGQMGQAIWHAAENAGDFTVAAGVDPLGGDFPFPVFSNAEKINADFDVAIDFSVAAAVTPILAYCVAHKKPLVIGTTGLSEAQDADIALAAQTIPLFHSGNMSLGVNLQIALCRLAASTLGLSADVEIVETHHNKKLDAPSGTAWMLAREVAEALPEPTKFVLDRHNERKRRDPHEIGIHAVRGGSVVGEHEVMFFCEDEVITIKHQAASKFVFAAGALRAAKFLLPKAPGLYSMRELVAEST